MWKNIKIQIQLKCNDITILINTVLKPRVTANYIQSLNHHRNPHLRKNKHLVWAELGHHKRANCRYCFWVGGIKSSSENYKDKSRHNHNSKRVRPRHFDFSSILIGNEFFNFTQEWEQNKHNIVRTVKQFTSLRFKFSSEETHIY